MMRTGKSGVIVEQIVKSKGNNRNRNTGLLVRTTMEVRMTKVLCSGAATGALTVVILLLTTVEVTYKN
jgi:hypothetical protein